MSVQEMEFIVFIYYISTHSNSNIIMQQPVLFFQKSETMDEKCLALHEVNNEYIQRGMTHIHNVYKSDRDTMTYSLCPETQDMEK